jgi:hypothetical protein
MLSVEYKVAQNCTLYARYTRAVKVSLQVPELLVCTFSLLQLLPADSRCNQHGCVSVMR